MNGEATIYRYIGGELSEGERDVFHRRMRMDDAFFEEAAPLIKFWCHEMEERGTVEQEARRLQAARERLWDHGRQLMGLSAEPYDSSAMTALVDGDDETRDDQTTGRPALAVDRWLLPLRVLVPLLAAFVAAIGVLVARGQSVVIFWPSVWVAGLRWTWLWVLGVPALAVASRLRHAWWLFTPARWLASVTVVPLLRLSFARATLWGPDALLSSARFVELLVPVILLYSPEIRLLAPWGAVAWNPARGLSRLAAVRDLGWRARVSAWLQLLVDPLWLALLLAFYAPQLPAVAAAVAGGAPFPRLMAPIPLVMGGLLVLRAAIWALFLVLARFTARIPDSRIASATLRTVLVVVIGYGVLRFAL